MVAVIPETTRVNAHSTFLSGQSPDIPPKKPVDVQLHTDGLAMLGVAGGGGVLIRFINRTGL